MLYSYEVQNKLKAFRVQRVYANNASARAVENLTRAFANAKQPNIVPVLRNLFGHIQATRGQKVEAMRSWRDNLKVEILMG